MLVCCGMKREKTQEKKRIYKSANTSELCNFWQVRLMIPLEEEGTRYADYNYYRPTGFASYSTFPLEQPQMGPTSSKSSSEEIATRTSDSGFNASSTGLPVTAAVSKLAGLLLLEPSELDISPSERCPDSETFCSFS